MNYLPLTKITLNLDNNEVAIIYSAVAVWLNEAKENHIKYNNTTFHRLNVLAIRRAERILYKIEKAKEMR